MNLFFITRHDAIKKTLPFLTLKQLFTGEKNDAQRLLALNYKKPKFLVFYSFPTHAIDGNSLAGNS